MEKVLIVEDDESVAGMLCKVIRTNGYEAVAVTSGEEALETVRKEEFTLMLLDINLTGMDGFEVIEKIRQSRMTLPIMIVSGRKEEYDTIYGLDIGADDYITKPFNPVTLGAKVKALIRRSRGVLAEENNLIKAGPFSYNTSTLRLYKNDNEIILTGKENAMMKLFLDNVNHIFSKDILYDMVWGESLTDDNAIMVYINRLRQKIEDEPDSPKFIQNVRGLGYRFVV